MNQTISSTFRSTCFLIALLPVVVLGCRTDPDPKPSDNTPVDEHKELVENTGFVPFLSEGGYSCGTIVKVDAESKTPIVPVVSREDWIVKPVERAFPAKTYRYWDADTSALTLSVDSIVEVERIRESIRFIDIVIGDADRCYVTVAHLITQASGMTQERRQFLSDVLERYRDDELAMLTEVLTLRDGSLVIHMVQGSSTDVNVDVSVLTTLFGAQDGSTEGDIVTLRYRRPVDVGYKIDDNAIPAVIAEIRKRRFYVDADGDGFGGEGFVWAEKKPDGYSEREADCSDSDAMVFPGQTEWFASPNANGDYDYNCDELQTKQFTTRGSCRSGCGSAHQGWRGDVPECGAKQHWLVDCDLKLRGCIRETDVRTQMCR